MSLYINVETKQYPLTVTEIMLANRHISFPMPFEPPDGYAAVSEVPQPDYNSDTHRIMEAPPVEVEGEWTQRWVAVPLSPAEKQTALQECKERLLASVTGRRWEIETGGVTLSNGMRLDTAREDQDAITRVLVNAQAAGITEVPFKAASGWAMLTIAQLQQAACAIALHVQACYAAEWAHHEAIEQLQSITAAHAYNSYDGWPSPVL